MKKVTTFFAFICMVSFLSPFYNANAGTHTISVGNNYFNPSALSVEAGDTIVFIYTEGNHTTTCSPTVNPNTSHPVGAADWNAPINSTHTSFTYIASVTGIYHYACNLTPGMSGTIDAGTGNPLPVELDNFVATTIKNEVILDWATIHEINNDRFEIQRAELNSGQNFLELVTSGNYEVIGYQLSQGNSNNTQVYRFNDKDLDAGRYSYRLKQIDHNGNFTYFLLNSEIIVEIPKKLTVKQNYPNPFNPFTSISYEIPSDGLVKVTVYDNLGKEVTSLVNEFMSAGYHRADFNAAGLSSGLYFYKVSLTSSKQNFEKVMKMMLVK